MLVSVTVNEGADPSPTVIIISFEGVAVQLREFKVLIEELKEFHQSITSYLERCYEQ